MRASDRQSVEGSFRRRAPLVFAFIVALVGLISLARRTPAQQAAHAAEPPHAAAAHVASWAMLHMEMSPHIAGTAADTARAARIAQTLRAALAPFADTTTAVAAGYRMFAPQLKNQKVYHFTSSWRGVEEAFRFDPAKPTSLLYTKGLDGTFRLVGAMYTAPKRFGPDKLDARIPLSIARWHKHVNWCTPKRGETHRWLERRDGVPVFGPESPIATKEACDAVGGTFHDTIFGWMVHANVFAGDDPATVWGDDHAGHDMHEGLSMDATHHMP